jgi:hypothetical protein
MSDDSECRPERDEEQEPRGCEWVTIRGCGVSQSVTLGDGSTKTTGWHKSWVGPGFMDGDGI